MSLMAGIDEMMYSCGVEILHPGGMEKTYEMALACKINKGMHVLDIGSGKGYSACRLAERFSCRVTGVDLSVDMVEYAKDMAAKKGLSDRVRFYKANAEELPFGDDRFDIVLAECSTVLMDKEKAFKEILRVTKAGGFVGDLEMIWQKPPGPSRIDKAREAWEGFETMTPTEWGAFYNKIGLVDAEFTDFSEALAHMGKQYMKALGIRGLIKMGWILSTNPRLRKGMLEYNKMFGENRGYFGYGYIVGRKAEGLG